MKTTIKELPKSQKKITIQFSQDDLLPFQEQAITQLGESITIPGYRPGKAPTNLLRNKISELKINERAAILAIEKKYPQIIKDNNLKAIGYPNITITKIVPHEIVEMTITTSIIPEISLPDYKEIASHSPKDNKEITVSPKEIDDAIKWLQKSRSYLKEVNRHPNKGDIITINYAIADKQTNQELDKKNNYIFILGQETIPPDLEKAMENTAPSITKTVEIKPFSKWQNKKLSNKNLKVTYTIVKVKEVVKPALNDDFAKAVGPFSTLKELKNNIEKELLEEKKRKEQEKWRLDVLEKIIKQTKVEVPDILTTTELNKIIAELKDQANQIHLTFEQYLQQIKKTEEEAKRDLLPLAEKRAKASLVLKEIANKEKVIVSPEEIEKKSQDLLKQIPADSKGAVNSEDLKSFAKGLLRSEKVFQFLEQLAAPSPVTKQAKKEKK